MVQVIPPGGQPSLRETAQALRLASTQPTLKPIGTIGGVIGIHG